MKHVLLPPTQFQAHVVAGSTSVHHSGRIYRQLAPFLLFPMTHTPPTPLGTVILTAQPPRQVSLLPRARSPLTTPVFCLNLDSHSVPLLRYCIPFFQGFSMGFLGFRVSGFPGFRVSGFQGFRVSGYQGIRVSGFQGFRVSGF